MPEQNSEKSEKISIKLKKFFKIHKFLPFFSKINPYKENQYNDGGTLIEKKSWVYYRAFSSWLIDIFFTGAFLNFILFVWGKQPLHILLVIGDGVTVWFVKDLLTKIWNSYIDGKIRITRYMR